MMIIKSSNNFHHDHPIQSSLSSYPRPGVDWEEKLIPYLNDGGATSVAVVKILLPSYYHIYFVSNVHKKTLGRNMLWLLHWGSYKRQV